MQIQDVMTKLVLAVPPELPADAAWHEMRRARIHHLVVMDGHRIVGIVSDRDLGGSHGDPVRSGRCVSDLMTSHVVVAAPELSLKQAATLLRGHRIGCLPVVDGKQLVGMITTSDLLDYLARARA